MISITILVITPSQSSSNLEKVKTIFFYKKASKFVQNSDTIIPGRQKTQKNYFHYLMYCTDKIFCFKLNIQILNKKTSINLLIHNNDWNSFMLTKLNIAITDPIGLKLKHPVGLIGPLYEHD